MSDEGGEMPCMAYLVDDDGHIPAPADEPDGADEPDDTPDVDA